VSEDDKSASPSLALAEITGLHGAFVFSERLLQQIWARGDFYARDLLLRDGRSLAIVKRGRWNRLPGPDFLDAEIRVGGGADGEVLRGDIELHLRASDWGQHGHAKDPAYANVILHVVLFPAVGKDATGADGRPIPTLELLPLLERDLEAYAEEAAVEALAGRPFSRLREALASVPAEELSRLVERHSARRWGLKTALARRRIEVSGWDAACHQAALEVLGYRPNRAPMLAVARCMPLEAWREGGDDDIVEKAWRHSEAEWVRGGVRPANQPRVRLEQYLRWMRARPDWPALLAGIGREFANETAALSASLMSGGLGQRRRLLRIPRWRSRMAHEVTQDKLGGSRLDTMICDAWLPLLAARLEMQFVGGNCDGWDMARRLWLDWRCGDAPAELLRLAKEFEVGGDSAVGGVSQGVLQGLLGWLAALPDEGGRGT
jgi:hypothetical protein